MVQTSTGRRPEKDTIVRYQYLEPREQIADRSNVEVHNGTIGKWPHEFRLTQLKPRRIIRSRMP